MEIASLCKIVGGLLAGIAHRYIVRVAWREGFSKGLAAMALPGFSLIFAVTHREGLKRALVVQLIGFALLSAGFLVRSGDFPAQSNPPAAMQAANAKNPKQVAPTPEVDRVAQFAKMTPEQKQERLTTWYQELETRRKSLKTVAEISAFNGEAQQYQALLSEVARNAPAGKPDLDPAQIKRRAQWYQQLHAKREKLDLKNPAAIVAFNKEVASYQASAGGDLKQGASASK